MPRVTITVHGLTPPSVNHYKVPQIFKRGKFHTLSWKITPEAELFMLAVRAASLGKTVAPLTLKEQRKVRYALRMTVYLGEGQRGDGDNFWKCAADSLVKAGVIHSDAAVDRWHLYKRRDRENPRTVITAWVLRDK